ncbi:MAG TPA: TonB-dependent receptor [Terriglobia bacterium]|nr:TonB-dependent receptor [Terriglobia bacterium]
MRRKWLFALWLFLLGMPLARAQQDVGYILGTVTDPTGAAIAGANVTITWQSTGLTQSAVTDQAGFYTSQPLQVGQYTVTATRSGFSSAAIHNLIVDAAAHVQANLTLQVGTTASNVVVQATPPVMDTTDAQLSNTIDAREAQQFPVNGRSVLALSSLTPGVVSSVGAVSEGFQNRGTAVSAVRIAGGPPGVNNNILDGVTNLQDWLGEIAINLKSDAVQEFNIMSGIIPAQFGYTAGGVINVVTRSGGNSLHGEAYEFFRNDALDAVQAYPRPAFGKQETRFNNYGGTLGGPLRKNKIFLFGNYEQYNYASALPAYFSLPTALEQTGNFSDLGQLVNGACQPVNIYDPGTATTTGARTQFAGNVIPQDRLDPVALSYQKLFYPLPNNSTGAYNSCTRANNYVYALPVIASERQGIVRSDYKLSNDDSLVARYAYYLNKTNNGTNAGGLPGIYSHRNDHLQTQDAVLSETHVFSPTLLNDARLGGMLSDFPFQAASAYQNVAGQIGLPNDTDILIPTMSNGLVAPNITLGFRSSTTMEGVDDLTWILKQHTLHIGGTVRFSEGYNNQTGSSPSGQFNFIAGSTAQGNNTTVTTGTGSQYASYLLGQVNSATQLVTAGSAFRRMMYALYIQDDWHATPRLTLNAGLRWDYMTQAVEKKNGIQNFDINQTNPVNGFLGAIEYAGVDGAGRNFVKNNYGDFGPRIGFAYSLTGDNKTIVRGGFAIYYPAVDIETYDQSSGSTLGYTSYTTTYTAPTTNGADFLLRNGFPFAWGVPLGAAGGQNAFLGQSAAYVLPSAKDPSSQQYTLTVSREMPLGVVADFSYLGNHGSHFLNASPNINTLPPQFYSLGTAALSASVPNPYKGLVPGSLGAATITEANLLKPFPYMSTVTLQYPRNAFYLSNLAMVSVQRRMQHGLQVIGAYTFGKILDEGVEGLSDLSAVGTSTSSAPQDWRNPRAEYSVDAIDVTHRLSLSGLYDLPFGVGQRFFTSSRTDRLASGWQYNVIMTLESGRPVSVTGANNHLATRPNLIANVPVKIAHQGRGALYKTGSLEWFNPAAFVNPPDYTFGDAPRYFSNVRGPGTVNFDMSLFKTTKITERTSLELRIEAYDALNHDNLSMPNASFSAGPPANPADPYAEGGLNTSSTFGKITASGAYRNVQLAAKIHF